MKSCKIWGQTEKIFSNSTAEVHLLDIKPGYVCSKHSHLNKYNRFIVLSGNLGIKLFDNDGNVKEEYSLTEGQTLDVKPGVIHQFNSLSDCKVLEIYWVDEINPNDIERLDIGHATSKGSV